jgi:hypothetical protein
MRAPDLTCLTRAQQSSLIALLSKTPVVWQFSIELYIEQHEKNQSFTTLIDILEAYGDQL